MSGNRRLRTGPRALRALGAVCVAVVLSGCLAPLLEGVGTARGAHRMQGGETGIGPAVEDLKLSPCARLERRNRAGARRVAWSGGAQAPARRPCLEVPLLEGFPGDLTVL